MSAIGPLISCLKELKIRDELWLEEITPAPTKNDPARVRAFRPNAPWALDEQEKPMFIQRVKSMRFPKNFAANVRSYFGGKNGNKLQHLKSYDFHVLMQHVIPVALRALLELGP